MTQICLPRPQGMGTSESLLRSVSECRVATHDGYIWPVPRHEMRSSHAIVDRMAEDFAKVVSTQNHVTLAGFGWLPDQLTKYRPAAVALYKQKQVETNRFGPAVRSFASGAAELACLALFTGMVGVWAIILGA